MLGWESEGEESARFSDVVFLLDVAPSGAEDLEVVRGWGDANLSLNLRPGRESREGI